MNPSFFVLATLMLCASAVVWAGPVVNQYFPMNNGDSRYYQDHDSPNNKSTEYFTQTTYNGHSVYSLNFHDEWNTTSIGTGTWYLSNSGTALTLYGINTAWGNMPFNSPANILTDQMLANNGTVTSAVTGVYSGQTFDITVKSSVSSWGTITVPAGTFYNCKLVLIVETATINGVFFNNYDSAAWVLAPGVGIIADGVATWDVNTGNFTFLDMFGSSQDYFELVSGKINNVPIDYAPPSNSISSPANNAQLYDNPAYISGIASDSGYGGNGIAQVTVNGIRASNDTSTGNGSAFWSTNIRLPAGANVITVIATDGAGNKRTNILNVTEMLSAPTLTMQPANQAVALGSNVLFSVTAASSLPLSYQWRKDAAILNGATNFSYSIAGVQTNQAGNYSVIVSNASGSITSSNAYLFVDGKNPVIAITNPAANARSSIAVTQVKGTAGDNGQVAQVFYQLNNDGWLLASGTTNWQGSVTLIIPGTNNLSAKSVDWVGNTSVITNQSIYYVVTALATVQTNGNGTISQNYNGQLLEIGKIYSMTATASPGFGFVNWTGTFGTNGATITFTMQTNLVLTANFVDVTKPTNSISSPTQGQPWSNQVFTIQGKASDNVAVANVFYQINSNGWYQPAPINNWSNWQATVSLRPGNNVLQAYAVDATGNLSTTNLVNFTYFVSDILRVQTTGQGTLTPNYNNALLEVGQNYSMTAVGTNGFAFTNWSSSQGWTSNTAVLTFTMVSNLTLTANFIDTNKPTMSITNLVGGQRWSNGVFTVRGTASDNWQVASVQYRLNGGSWSLATGTTNWSVPLTLTPGTNTFAAYATDTTGNNSTTNSVNFQYVVTNQLQLSITGLGTISPNYSNAWLEIGRNYSITSAPAAGFTFTNWTGSVTAYTAALSFSMASNLTFVANFIDTNKPVFSITNLTAGQRISNSVFTVRGTASDNWQIANVQYQLNGGGWGTATGTTNWSAALTLIPGTNTVAAFATDNTGNVSATTNVSFQYVVTNQLQLSITGLGTISPNYSNAWLEIGRNYSITSAPAAGFTFSNWTGSVTAYTAALNFTMDSNLTFIANFIDTNKPVLSITNLVAGQRWSNGVFTVRGTASDNWQVASLQYQLNGLTWSNATTTNAWTNWYATLNLVPGTNTVAAYATDNTGNVSATTNLNFQYVVTNQLQIRTTGKGTISPNYSNAWLEIGRNYSITSAPATGFVFTNWMVSTNWVGVATVTGTNLLLMMQSNLTLLATFVETSRPTLVITAPTNNQKMTNALVTGIGTASDNWQISNIWYQLNSNAWNLAATANSFTNWSTPLLTLVIGTNTLKAYALNLGGNYSLTNSVSFVSSNTFALQLVFTNAQPVKTNGVIFSLQLSSGLNGRIQVSTNLIDWNPLTNFVGSNAAITFRDPAATNSSQRFYRAIVP